MGSGGGVRRWGQEVGVTNDVEGREVEGKESSGGGEQRSIGQGNKEVTSASWIVMMQIHH